MKTLLRTTLRNLELCVTSHRITMRLTCLSLFILISLIIVSVLLSILSNLISHDVDEDDQTSGTGNHKHSVKVKTELYGPLGASPNHVMWFIQISDIHLSIFHDSNRISDFMQFTNRTLDAIKPAVVLASGDLADGKAIDTMGSDQYLEEWEHYKTILDTNKVTEKTIWLDIRGNHDNFNVPGVHHERSYFHRYSVQGRKHLRSYMYKIVKESDHYAFIAVDACLEPGPRRPFNFIGSITKDQFQLLEQFEQDSTSDEKIVGTIWFGHYPTSCVVSPEPGFRHLMRHGVAYLCGHLHTLGGVVPNMYTLHKSGVLELELGDWKDNRIFRIGAFDHGLFSFVDVVHEKWPVILVTNPKHALYALPKKEGTQQIGHSTHIRILVFSPYPIKMVKVKIDNSKEWKKCQSIKGPLYVSEWDPSMFSKGLHNIHVQAEDQIGNSLEISQPFSVDGSRITFGLLARIALMTDAHTVFFGIFVFLILFSVLPIVALRWLHYLVKRNHVDKNLLQDIYFSNLVRKLWIMTTIDKLYYPVIIYPLYITVGPWFIGEVIEGHIGAAFSWGTYVSGKVLPTSFTYFYGVSQLFWFHIPFVLLLSGCVDSRFRTLSTELGSSSRRSFCKKHIPCGFIVVLQSVFAFYFWQAYGTIALIFGPFRTWCVIMGFYLWYSSATLSLKDFVEARSLWKAHPMVSQNGECTHDL